MDPPRTKRQKVIVACDTCRSRKIKCDGRQPVCQPCHQKLASGATCTWQSGFDRMSAQVSTNSVHWANFRPHLQSPLSHSQSERHQSGSAYQGHNSQIAGGHRSSASGLIQPIFHSANISSSFDSPSAPNARAADLIEGGVTGFHQPQETAQPSDEVSPSEHSVHAIIGAALDEDSREGFFGSSSAATFMQNVKKMVQQKVGGLSGQPASSQHIQTQTSPTSGHNTLQPKPVEYVLPSRRRADILMSCYWRYVHVLYPYVDKMQMEEDYEKLWKAEDSVTDERSFMCMINVVFALSSQIDDSTPIEDRRQSAHVFYVRARELLDIVETGSVRSVQTLLLLGQYYQSTSEPHPCWIFTGLAIHTAQSLGLHLAETSECVVDIKTRELLRKVWHGCILMDRVVSMTYGRPCTIGPKAALAVPLPLPIDEEYLVHETLQGQPVQTQVVEFYVLSLKLYEIMHDIIFTFYSVNTQPCQPGDEYFGSLEQGQNSVLQIERRLSRWANGVPSRLRVTTGSKPQVGTMEATFYRQAVILHQR